MGQGYATQSASKTPQELAAIEQTGVFGTERPWYFLRLAGVLHPL
jgi:hypothetical protein